MTKQTLIRSKWKAIKILTRVSIYQAFLWGRGGGAGGWRSADGRGANSTFLQFEKFDTHAAKRYTWFVNQFRKTTLKVVKTEKYM